MGGAAPTITPELSGPAGEAGAASDSSGGAGGEAPSDDRACWPAHWRATASVLCHGDGLQCPGWSNNPQGPAQAIDGDLRTRYTSGDAQQGNEEFVLWFAASVTISGVQVHVPWWDDAAAGYALEASIDGASFTAFDPPLSGEPQELRDPTASGLGPPYYQISFPPTHLRALKIKQTGAQYGWWSITELTVIDCVEG
jgi:F5/8 type C domain